MQRPIHLMFCTALAAIALNGATSFSPTTAFVQTAVAQDVLEFRMALEPYGMWRSHPRFGEVWVPFGKPRDWRPYTVGHWVYTDEWGWYWVSEEDEEDWGWVAFHYGRWSFSRGMGWFWIPGDEWAPAWVNWRGGSDAVGWAPMPPEDVYDAYDSDPTYWTFVQPRYLTEPSVRRYYYPPERRVVFLRQTVVVNRTVVLSGRQFAVNPGYNPARVAAARGAPLATFSVRPRVLASTQGVNNAVQVNRDQLGRRGDAPRDNGRRLNRDGRPGARPGAAPPPSGANRLTIEATQTTIKPASLGAPQALPRGERGRLGNNPPRAAEGTTITAPASPPAAGSRGAPPAPGATPPAPSAPGATPPAPAAGARPGAPAPQSPAAAPPPPPAAAPPAPPAPPRAPEVAPAAPPPPRAINPQSPPPPATNRAPPPAAAPNPDRPPPNANRPQPPEGRPAERRGPPPEAQRPQAAPPQAQPPAARPAPPPPPAAAPPPAARPPAPPPPPAAAPPPPRPAAPPPPAAARPAPPPPSAAKPAPPPAAAKPAPPPEEKK